jgi:hypothetical protein
MDLDRRRIGRGEAEQVNNEIQEWLTPERVAEGWEALSEGVFKSVNKRGDGFEVYQYYDWDTCEYYYSVSFEAMGECVLRKRFETFTEAADAAERLYKFLKEEGYCGLQ